MDARKKAVIRALWPALILGASLAWTSAVRARDASPGLVVLFTHDLHSNVLPRTVLGSDGARSTAGGFARLATLIRREHEAAPGRTLVLDAGDYSMGTLFHTLYAEESFELRLLGLMGYDAVAFGNHEFDFRLDGLSSSLAAAKAKGTRLPTVVASNIAVEGPGEVAEAGRAAFRDFPVRDYVVFERAGLKVGVFGIFGPNAADDSPFADPAVFLDPVEHARRVVGLLRTREKADLVVCLSHTGITTGRTRTWDILLAEEVPGIDVIVSG
ncbi:MAG: bifunctional metallophosphatase/5'-nucleotidase, partial [Candidatus Aminicenantes bacterium]|nr:bifunctional metallophosphatase/5'-nucleotidase [Candidatus Aminicenantes bacterium]